jgi:hypothetical protein
MMNPYYSGTVSEEDNDLLLYCACTHRRRLCGRHKQYAGAVSSFGTLLPCHVRLCLHCLCCRMNQRGWCLTCGRPRKGGGGGDRARADDRIRCETTTRRCPLLSGGGRRDDDTASVVSEYVPRTLSTAMFRLFGKRRCRSRTNTSYRRSRLGRWLSDDDSSSSVGDV